MSNSTDRSIGIQAAGRMLPTALGLGAEHQPFPWQERLLQTLVTGRIPRALDLPTGLGKTSVIAIWLLARAAGALLPRRLVYVVDRRAVVDQATSEAMRLREWVQSHAEVADALDVHDGALPISTLRGQHVDNRHWLEDPAASAIVVGTVDMIGSRLLFEGYGVSRKMRPYHAGLLGMDSLLVLDEAHLVPSFERLVEDVAEQDDQFGPASDEEFLPVQRIRVMSLSATGRDHAGDVLRLAPEDLANPGVDRRVGARKELQRVPLPAATKLPDHLAQVAWDLAEDCPGPVRCVVYVDRRKDAQRVETALQTLAREGRDKDGPHPTVDLFVGGRRVRERTQAAQRLEELGFVAGRGVTLDDHAFLVSTSAGEVGVDLDAEHAVMDLVAWERMVQRLGRVNRRGGDGLVARVLVVRDEMDDKDPRRERADAVERLIEQLPTLEDGSRDASPRALGELVARENLRPLFDLASTAEPLRPRPTRPLVEAWSMTSLREHTGRPEVAPWLRGWVEDEAPRMHLAWRKYLPPSDATERERANFFEAATVHASERLETELWRVEEWLVKRSKSWAKAGGDDLPDAAAVLLDRASEVVRAFTREELLQLTDQPKQRRERDMRAWAGGTLVLAHALGGLSDTGLLDAKAASEVPTADSVESSDDWISTDDAVPAVPFRVRPVEDPETEAPDPPWTRARCLPRHRAESGDVTEWLVVDVWRHRAPDEDGRSAGRPQLLDDHLAQVRDKVLEIASRLDVSAPTTSALEAAARLHDVGKRAGRWQAAFHAPRDGIYAKTRGPLDHSLLAGYRHEFGSLLAALDDEGIRALPEDVRDLALHLVAAHHGGARPTLATTGCEQAPDRESRQHALDTARRFVRMQRRWGPWGLAWLEAVLRAADQQASRENDRRPAREEVHA